MYRKGQPTSIQVSVFEANEVKEYVELYRKLYGNVPKHTAIMNAIRSMKARLEDEIKQGILEQETL